MPSLCVVTFTYHGNLAFTEAISVRYRLASGPYAVSCSPVGGAAIYSYVDADASWLKDETQKEAYRLLDSRERPLKFTYLTMGPPSKPLGTVEPQRFCRCEIAFEIEGTIESTESQAFGAAIDRALYAFDKFVDLYRWASNALDAQRPYLEKLSIVEVWVASDYTWLDDEITGNLMSVGRRLIWDNVRLDSRYREPMDPPEFARFQGQLSKGCTLSTAQQLLLDAREQSQLQRQHDLGIVLSAMAVEVHLRYRIGTECADRSVTELAIGRGNTARNLPVEEALERASLDDLFRILEVLSSMTLKGTAVYNAWREHTHRQRSAIVHMGAIGRTEADAIRAWEAARNLVREVSRVMPDRYGCASCRQRALGS
jgi:hypothetical protein